MQQRKKAIERLLICMNESNFSASTKVKISKDIYDTKYLDRPEAIKMWIDIIHFKTENEVLEILENKR